SECGRRPSVAKHARIAAAQWTTSQRQLIAVLSRLFRSTFLGLLLLQGPKVFCQTAIFSEGFEGPFPVSGGWSVSDTDPFGAEAYWNAVDASFGGAGVHSGIRKAYCAGIGFGGTAAQPNYQADMGAFMSRPINLGGLMGSTLT